MSNDNIVSNNGEVVGQWNGQDVKDLQTELMRIKKELLGAGKKDKVTPSGIPHQEQFPEDLKGFTAYLLWACDQNEVCLVGSGANRTESVSSIREFYANDIAKDALSRARD